MAYPLKQNIKYTNRHFTASGDFFCPCLACGVAVGLYFLFRPCFGTEKLVVPKSVQAVIPIKTIWEDGIFLVGRNKYAKTFKLEDINYAVASRLLSMETNTTNWQRKQNQNESSY